MWRSISTYRSLIPFTTNVAVAPKWLADALLSSSLWQVRHWPHNDLLAAHHQRQPLALSVDNYDRTIRWQEPWGSINPSAFLEDGDSEEMPRGGYPNQSMKQKLPAAIADGLLAYTTALRVIDLVAHLEGSTVAQTDILVHVKREGWVGTNEVRCVPYNHLRPPHHG